MSTQPRTALDIPAVAAPETFSASVELLRVEALMAFVPAEPSETDAEETREVVVTQLCSTLAGKATTPPHSA